MREFLIRALLAFIAGGAFGLALALAPIGDPPSPGIADVVTAEWIECVKSGGHVDVDHGYGCFLPEPAPDDQIGALLRGAAK